MAADWLLLEEELAAQTAAAFKITRPGDPEYWAQNSELGYDVDDKSLLDASVISLPGVTSMVVMSEPRQQTYFHLLDAISHRKAVSNPKYSPCAGTGKQDAIVVRLGGSGIERLSWLPSLGSGAVQYDTSYTGEHHGPNISPGDAYIVTTSSKMHDAGLSSYVTEAAVDHQGSQPAPLRTALHHFHYQGWPDKGVPSDILTLDNLVARVAKLR